MNTKYTYSQAETITSNVFKLETYPGNFVNCPSIVSSTVGRILHPSASVVLATVRNEQASVIPEPVWSFGLLHLSMAFWRVLVSKFKINGVRWRVTEKNEPYIVSHPFWKSPCQEYPVGSLNR